MDKISIMDNKILKYLPYYKSNESYKYLGIWINLNLGRKEEGRK